MQSKNNKKLKRNLNDPLDNVKTFLRHASSRKVYLPCTTFATLLKEALHKGRRKAEDMWYGKERMRQRNKEDFQDDSGRWEIP